MPKRREIKEYSTDPAAQEMLIRAEELGIGTAFHARRRYGSLQYRWRRYVLQAMWHGALPSDQRRSTLVYAAQPLTPSRPAT